MSNRANVSGHSGLPEKVELRMMQEKMEKRQKDNEFMYMEFLDLMNKHGIAPGERRKFIIRFSRWMELKTVKGFKPFDQKECDKLWLGAFAFDSNCKKACDMECPYMGTARRGDK